MRRRLNACALFLFTCGAFGVYLRWFRLHGGCRFEYTSGGSCGRACIVPPIDWDIYLRCKKYHNKLDTARSPIVGARRKGAKVTPRPQRNTEQMETDRRA